MPEPQPYKTLDEFDRLLGSLHKLPDVSTVKAATVTTVSPLLGEARTFIVRTYRQKEKGDTIFIEYVGGGGYIRLALPPEAADAIARQRDALSTKNRKRAAKERAAKDKAAGRVPGFARKKKGGA